MTSPYLDQECPACGASGPGSGFQPRKRRCKCGWSRGLKPRGGRIPGAGAKPRADAAGKTRSIRLSDQEMNLLREAAAGTGLTPLQWLRTRGMQQAAAVVRSRRER